MLHFKSPPILTTFYYFSSTHLKLGWISRLNYFWCFALVWQAFFHLHHDISTSLFPPDECLGSSPILWSAEISLAVGLKLSLCISSLARLQAWLWFRGRRKKMYLESLLRLRYSDQPVQSWSCTMSRSDTISARSPVWRGKPCLAKNSQLCDKINSNRWHVPANTRVVSPIQCPQTIGVTGQQVKEQTNPHTV